jgi:hypothetical protein
MSIAINAAEISELTKMRALARGGVIKYWAIYKWLADTLVYNKGVSATDQTVLWLRGATEANARRGAFSAIIRTFTETQYKLRYDGVSTPYAGGLFLSCVFRHPDFASKSICMGGVRDFATSKVLSHFRNHSKFSEVLHDPATPVRIQTEDAKMNFDLGGCISNQHKLSN